MSDKAIIILAYTVADEQAGAWVVSKKDKCWEKIPSILLLST